MKAKYRFSIAAENAAYRGYTSEKLLTSFAAHTIPIYWGNPNIANDYNEKAFINSMKYSLDEVIDKVIYLDNHKEEYCKMLCEPFMTRQQEEQDIQRTKEYYQWIITVLRKGEKRVGEGYHPSCYLNWFTSSTDFKYWIVRDAKDVMKKMILHD